MVALLSVLFFSRTGIAIGCLEKFSQYVRMLLHVTFPEADPITTPLVVVVHGIESCSFDLHPLPQSVASRQSDSYSSYSSEGGADALQDSIALITTTGGRIHSHVTAPPGAGN